MFKTEPFSNLDVVRDNFNSGVNTISENRSVDRFYYYTGTGRDTFKNFSNIFKTDNILNLTNVGQDTFNFGSYRNNIYDVNFKENFKKKLETSKMNKQPMDYQKLFFGANSHIKDAFFFDRIDSKNIGNSSTYFRNNDYNSAVHDSGIFDDTNDFSFDNFYDPYSSSYKENKFNSNFYKGTNYNYNFYDKQSIENGPTFSKKINTSSQSNENSNMNYSGPFLKTSDYIGSGINSIFIQNQNTGNFKNKPNIYGNPQNLLILDKNFKETPISNGFLKKFKNKDPLNFLFRYNKSYLNSKINTNIIENPLFGVKNNI